MNTYAEVILPLPLNTTFTYAVPDELLSDIKIGHRVIVPFGKKRFYTGIVVSLSPKAPEGYEVKEIALSLDSSPIVKHPQVKLWEWISDYYLCAIGDVYKAAVPAGLKIESESFIEINPDYEIDDSSVTDEREVVIIQLLQHEGALTIDAIEKKTGLKNIHRTIDRLIDHGIVIISEKLVERYRSRKENYVRPTFGRGDLQKAFELVKGAKKQETMLLALIELTGIARGENREVSRAALLERSAATSAILLSLVKKGLVEIYKKEINRFAYDGSTDGPLPRLSQAQDEALDLIHRSWLEHEVTLLHGVTSSGKTEIYQHLIADALNRGRQTLLLVPEIALTTQLTRRMQAIFGNKVVIYHSKFSDNERVDIWKRLLHSTEPIVVIGARSAVFLPFANLGLVIVDEEHEQSYKQFDPAPRYNARDTAIVLAGMHGAKTLLGSATPTIETYYKAKTGKFGLVTLSVRYNNVKLPDIKVIDMNHARKHYLTKGVFGTDTLKLAHETLSRKDQIIFFQNRRGFSPIARCKQCAWTPRCQNCDVALTYHRDIDRLVCHYCGATYPLPRVCPQCKEPAIETIGYGTERIEDEVVSMFPDHKVSRMDLDTTRNKDGYETIIDSFSNHKSDILIGTQMVTKGLDFGGVSMVAVLNADAIINFPDFRSSERAFNMLEQISGRAGRRQGSEATVVVQTMQPEHPIIGFLLSHDYTGFYDAELQQRRQFNYPPFTRVIYIYLKHRDRLAIGNIATIYTNRLHQLFGNRVLGPEKPLVERVNSLYIRKIMLKVEVDASMKKVKEILRAVYEEMHQNPEMKSTTVYYDVDPM